MCLKSLYGTDLYRIYIKQLNIFLDTKFGLNFIIFCMTVHYQALYRTELIFDKLYVRTIVIHNNMWL